MNTSSQPWGNEPAPDSYNIYKSTTSGSFTDPPTNVIGTNLSNIFVSLTSGTIYYFKIESVQTINGYTSTSNVATTSATTDAAPITVPPPANFTATATTSTSITCTWSKVDIADSYFIYLSTTSGSFTSPIGITPNTTTTNLFSGLTTGTHYYFRIEAYKNTTPIPTISVPADFDMILAAGPTNFTTSTITATSITCTWNQVTSADSYKIYISTTSGSFTSPIDITPKTTTTNLFSGLNPSTTYYFQIVSVKTGTLSAAATTNATTLAATPAETTKQINLFPLTGPPIPTSLTYPGQSTLSISIAKNKLPNTFSLVRLTVTNAAKNRVITQANKKRQQIVSGSTTTINISFNLFTVASGNSITFEKIHLEGRKNNKWYTIGYRKRVTYYVP